MSGVGERVDSARVERIRIEDGFGDRVRGWIAKSGEKFADVARALGIRREDLYEVMDGQKHARAAWLELLPPSVERLYLAERAAHHGLELRPVGDAGSEHARMHRLVAELTDVVRVSAVNEADGHLSPDEALEELNEIEEAERALVARKAWLRTVIEARGMRVVGGGR